MRKRDKKTVPANVAGQPAARQARRVSRMFRF